MANGKIKISELPNASVTHDEDVFIIESDTTTQKISLGSMINYIREHEEIVEHFVKQSDINSENGVAPLDGNRKVPCNNLPFGTTENTIFDGALGQSLTEAYSTLNENFQAKTESLQEQINNISSSTGGSPGEMTSAVNATLTYNSDLGDAQNRVAYYYNNFLYINLYFLKPKVTGYPTFTIDMRADGYETASVSTSNANIAVMYLDNSAVKIISTTTMNGKLNFQPHMTNGVPLFISFVFPVRKIGSEEIING